MPEIQFTQIYPIRTESGKGAFVVILCLNERAVLKKWHALALRAIF